MTESKHPFLFFQQALMFMKVLRLITAVTTFSFLLLFLLQFTKQHFRINLLVFLVHPITLHTYEIQ